MPKVAKVGKEVKVVAVEPTCPGKTLRRALRLPGGSVQTGEGTRTGTARAAASEIIRRIRKAAAKAAEAIRRQGTAWSAD